ncbi:hypothetical protein SAMN05421761_10578 [Belliella pelovolcani]|uniref:Outer membrane protein beta-barrel domain-containing protein n=2 Tax=Belliella pelovolcani TaxID=529505 RepID=A0A1N7M404_9BACT|nr:hypothetical protein SAMN05421761_10578 [Belliella pelovolcani]
MKFKTKAYLSGYYLYAMKKLFVILFFLPFLSFGQFSKGTKYLGGSVSLETYKYDTGAGMTPYNLFFSSHAHLGIFLNESIAIGPTINFNRTKIPTINPATNLFEERRSNSLAGGIFIRKFFPITEIFLFSLEGSAIIGQINRDSMSQFTESKSTIYNFSIFPAFMFLPNQKWGFDANIGTFRYGANYRNPFSEERNFEARLGQVNLGIKYFFGRSNLKN